MMTVAVIVYSKFSSQLFAFSFLFFLDAGDLFVGAQRMK